MRIVDEGGIARPLEQVPVEVARLFASGLADQQRVVMAPNRGVIERSATTQVFVNEIVEEIVIGNGNRIGAEPTPSTWR